MDDQKYKQDNNNQNQNKKKIGYESRKTFPLTLFKQQHQMVVALCCFKLSKCSEVPVQPMATADKKVVCEDCCKKHKLNASVEDFAQSLILDLQLSCANNEACDVQNSQNEGEGGVQNQNVFNERCNWSGKLCDWQVHNSKVCTLTIVTCPACRKHACQRKYMNAHLSTCPNVIVHCNLKCGICMIRSELARHIEEECDRTLLECSNTGCTLRVERVYLRRHETEQCVMRIVECPFEKYGCKQAVTAKSLRAHMKRSKLNHVFCKLQCLDGEVQQLEQKNHQLKNEVNQMKLQSKSNKNKVQQLENTNYQLKNEMNQMRAQSKANQNKLDRLEHEMQQLKVGNHKQHKLYNQQQRQQQPQNKFNYQIQNGRWQQC